MFFVIVILCIIVELLVDKSYETINILISIISILTLSISGMAEVSVSAGTLAAISLKKIVLNRQLDTSPA